ncbi:hypothetical protein [Desulfurobacterium crinifex]
MYLNRYLLPAALLLFTNVYASTYPIVEPDLLTEIQERAKYVNYSAIKKRFEELYKHYKPKEIVQLPPAKKSYSYLVDMTYELPFDVPKVDKSGRIVGILYPKGFKFNPLKYIPVDPPVLIVFNGNSKEEINWVEKHIKSFPAYHKLIITDGNWQKLTKKFKEQVYFLTPRIKERLNLKETISVVRRKGDYMKVKVIAVNCENILARKNRQ